jgi:hypothetical protein
MRKVLPLVLLITLAPSLVTCHKYSARREQRKAFDQVYYPGALSLTFQEIEIIGMNWSALTMYTPDSEEQVLSYYQGLEDNGWVIDEIKTDEDGTTILYMHYQYLVTIITFMEKEGDTYIVLGIPQNK